MAGMITTLTSVRRATTALLFSHQGRLAWLAAAGAVALLARAAAPAPVTPPPAVLDALMASVLVFGGGGKGVAIAPALAVTHAHALGPGELRPGFESKLGFTGLVDPVIRLVKPEHMRRARIVCYSPPRDADYIMWELLEPPPEGIQPLRTTNNLNAIRWAGSFRAYYTGNSLRSARTQYAYPEVRVPGKAVIPGWSGTPVLTDSGELVGLVITGTAEDLELAYITYSSWWTCHNRR